MDPADRVAATKVNADGIQTWSVSEVDKKGKKKKGTLGIGNGALFFASEADKVSRIISSLPILQHTVQQTPVQKWRTQDVINVSIEKSKHLVLEIGGATPTNLHFLAGSKDNVDAIMTKLDTSKALSSAQDSSATAVGGPSDSRASSQETKKPSVHFSNSSPEIIPAADDDEDEEAHDQALAIDDPRPSVHEEQPEGEIGIVLYDFTADGDDELSSAQGERLIILERDSDEWWKCQNSKGATGVVPASYVEVFSL